MQCSDADQMEGGSDVQIRELRRGTRGGERGSNRAIASSRGWQEV